MNLKPKLALAAGLAVLVAAAAASAAVVHPGNTHGWAAVHENCDDGASTGAQGFETGPGAPPAGNGSYFFKTGSDGDSYETLRTNRYAGVDLDDLTALSYWAYVGNAQTAQAPYIDLYIDKDGDGDKDDTLTFEPAYQGGVLQDTWQQWNALTGLWWSDDAGGPPPLFTLAQYEAANPNAQIVTDQRGLLLSAGCGGSVWANFDGNVDLVKIGVSGRTDTYNFEPTGPKAKGPKKGKAKGKAKVTICHKGKTKQVPESALKGHLGHGDKRGAC